MQNFKTTQDIVDHIIFKSFIKMSAPIMYRKILKVVSRNSPIFSASISNKSLIGTHCVLYLNALT